MKPKIFYYQFPFLRKLVVSIENLIDFHFSLPRKVKDLGIKKTIFLTFYLFFAVPVLRTGSVREKKEPELTPKKFGHNINSNFQ
jgi:hypothetical protein